VKFRWNNEWQKSLSVKERQQARMHELGHVAVANASDEAKNQAMKELLDFSRGYPCPEPLPEGQCILDFRNAPPRAEKTWDVAKDFAIDSTVKG
jgi:hypothetical protein